jgi:peptidyl-dipeptidase Dcp
LTDPLLEESALTLGAPEWDRIAPEAFLPAFDRALALADADLERIATDPAPPTFANTVEALERGGSSLARVRRLFWTVASAQATPAIRAIEGEVSARLTRFGTRLSHDPRLFARYAAVWGRREQIGLDEDQRRLLEDGYRGFVSGGALLEAGAKARFAAIDERLAALGTAFGQNLLAEVAGWRLLVDEAELAGVPGTVRSAAAERAERAGAPGRYLLTLDRNEVEALLAFADNRGLRERLWRAFTGRCDGGQHDNWPLIGEILSLRQERAALLGYRCYADERLRDTMAGTPDAAEALLRRVWAPALVRADAERRELKALAGADGITFEPWDWRYYAERVRREWYALDGATVKEHLTLDRVAAAAWNVAERLHGLRFERRPDLPGWHADVQAWTVRDAASGTERGLLYTDWYARPEKHGGAWMGSIRVQERLDGPVQPIVYLCANYLKPPTGDATGLSIDEARTLFHEFGHALHALLSDVRYPSQAGTAVTRDFVEFPSKFMEHWIVAPEVLDALGLPAPLVSAIAAADAFGQGFATVEFVASALLDMAFHRAEGPVDDPRALADAAMREAGLPAAIVPRHGPTHFTHIFDGGYAAAYYSYLWSEVLDEDAWAAFIETGDIFDPALADAYRREVLARGNTRDPLASFVAFRGRAPDERALVAARGLG